MTEDEIRSRLAARLAEKVGITPCESCGRTSWQSNSGVYFQSSCIEETDAIVFKASTRVQCASCSNRQRIGVFESLPCASLA